jgi:hypothetical protein
MDVFDLANGFNPAQPRHRNIEDNQIRRRAVFQQIKKLKTVIRLSCDCDIGSFAENQLQPFPKKRVVIR